MFFNMNGIFMELLPYLPETIVPHDVISGIKRLNEKLPAALTTAGIIECHLGGNDARADWQLCVNSYDSGRDIISGKVPDTDLDKSLFDDPRWRRIRSFSINWADPLMEIHNRIRHIWLEFDQDAMKEDIPVPGVFWTVDKTPGVPVEGSRNADMARECVRIIEVLELLREKPIQDEIKSRLLSCLQALPVRSEVHYAAAMLSRDQDAVRIVISLTGDNLAHYLADIDYPGSIEQVMEVCSELGKFGNLRYLLDISDTVLPRVGVECFISPEPETYRTAFKSVIDYLVSSSLCLPEKSAAFLSWPGHSSAKLPNELFPSYIYRLISHIKIVCQDRLPLEAKGYLSFGRRFTSDILSDLEIISRTDKSGVWNS